MNKVKGLDELISKLKKLKGLQENKHALLAGAFVIEAGAKKRAPVETGFLRGSITSSETEKGAKVTVGANYGYYQEFGSAHNKAQPYIRPTLDEDQDDIVKAVAIELQREIDAIRKGGG